MEWRAPNKTQKKQKTKSRLSQRVKGQLSGERRYVGLYDLRAELGRHKRRSSLKKIQKMVSESFIRFLPIPKRSSYDLAAIIPMFSAAKKREGRKKKNCLKIRVRTNAQAAAQQTTLYLRWLVGKIKRHFSRRAWLHRGDWFTVHLLALLAG